VDHTTSFIGFHSIKILLSETFWIVFKIAPPVKRKKSSRQGDNIYFFLIPDEIGFIESITGDSNTFGLPVYASQ